ncbi:MAG: peptidylprolyl isomerase [Paenirhodobacter sp.]
MMVRFSSLMSMVLTLGLTLGPATPGAWAQSPAPLGSASFSPVILVNGLGVTGYEIEQRMAFMQLLHQTGDLRAAAEKSLIEDRLRNWQAKQDGITLEKDAVEKGMAEFASRANLSTEQFLAEIAKAGVDPQTYRDFVTAGLLWREVVRAHFAPSVVITDADIDRALAVETNRGRGTRVLISEIVIPAPPGEEGRAMAAAEQAARARGEAAFAAAAREYSATATRDQGGRVNWMPLENLPPALRGPILALAPGQTTAPMQIPGAVAVFMLRGLDEGGAVAKLPQTLGYATLTLGPPGAPETEALAAKAAAGAKDCDDLYTVAKDLPASWLTRVAPESQAAVPGDVALALSHLDVGETERLHRGGNDTLVMLCSRDRVYDAAKGEAAPSRDDVRNGLLNARMSALADSYLADLMANAVIVRK